MSVENGTEIGGMIIGEKETIQRYLINYGRLEILFQLHIPIFIYHEFMGILEEDSWVRDKEQFIIQKIVFLRYEDQEELS